MTLKTPRYTTREERLTIAKIIQIFPKHLQHKISIFYDLKQLRKAIMKQQIKGKYKPQTQKYNINEK